MFQEKDGTVDELKQALVENLEHSGVLNKIRAEVITPNPLSSRG